MANAKTQAYLANLKKTGPLDASPVTAKPVAQTAVTTPKPITTQPVVKPVQQQAQNTVKTVAPVTPTPVPASSATTVPETPKTTPTIPVQTKTTTPPNTQQKTSSTKSIKTPLDAGLSSDGLDYQAQDQARLNEIQSNLTNYSQTSPEMFKTRDAFDANFKYGERSDEQKKVLDNFYKEYQLKQGNPDFVYQTLMTGGSIDPKYQNSAGFQQGYQKYQKIGMFGSMDAKQLATQLGKKLIVGSTEWQEIAKINPMLAQEALQEKKKLDAEKTINGTYADMTGIEEGRIQEVDVVTEALTKLYDKLGSLNIDIAEEYKKNVLENPVINDRYVAMEQRASKIAELQSVRDRAIDEAYASAGGAPDSVIRARANMQYRALNNQIALMQSDQEIDQAMLDTDIKRYEGMYNAKIDEYNQEVAQFQEQAKYVGGIAETISGTLTSQREDKAAAEQSQLEYERDLIKQQALQEYEMTKDQNAYLREIQKADVAYNREIQKLQISSNLSTQSSMTLAQQKAQLESGALSISQATNNWLTTPAGTDIGMQCGAYANKATGNMGTPGGNNLQERIKAFKDQEPVIGGQVLFVGGGYDKTYGHIAVITGVNGDGTINVKESNLRGDNKITERTIPLQGSNISGFYNNTPLAKQTATGSQSLDDVLKSSSLGEGTKTNLSKIKGVLEAINTLASDNYDGEFKGVGKGVAFDVFSSPEAIKNRGYLDAVNLMVQQWASGASLTEQQIKQVNKLVPNSYDTDSTVKGKLDALKNFMNDQAKATLSVNGVDYTPDTSSLWSKNKTTSTPNKTTRAGSVDDLWNN